MRFGTQITGAVLALGLVAFTVGPLVAQDSTPPVAKDTSRAGTVRPDTAGQAYKPMGAPANCPAPSPDLAAARRLPGDTPAPSPIRADTTIRDSTAAAVATAQEESAQRRAAEAVGVYHPPAKTPDVARTPCPPAAGKSDSVAVRPVTPDSVPAAPQPADTARRR